MQLSSIIRGTITLALYLACASITQADIQVTQTVNLAQTLPTTGAYKKIPPAQRARMEQSMKEAPYQVTTIEHGKITRLNYGPYYEIATPGKDDFYIVNPGSHSYIIQHFTYFRDNAGIPWAPVTMKITNKTRTIAGHRCRDYHITGSPEGGTLSGDLWVAADIPSTPGPMAEAVFNGILLKPWPSVKGLPLEVDMTIISAKKGNLIMTVKTDTVTSVSVTADMFIVPKSYSATRLNN